MKLVRYFDGGRIFAEELDRELRAHEFCYKPSRLVPFEEYSRVYRTVWRRFYERFERGLLIFDGSLLHHPINDMIANYSVTKEQAVEHILSLLASLGETERESSAHFLQTSSP